MSEEKFVLDACCGSRMFWFDKNDPRSLFIDVRAEEYVVDKGTEGTKGRSPKVVAPDIIADFTKMPFRDESFYHVVFDPPHLLNAGKGTINFCYGSLSRESWREQLRLGFKECFRVLRPNGTLIFKWAENDIPLKEVLSLTDQKPLYGHRSGKKAMTHWVSFIKA